MSLPTPDRMYEALCARDAAFEGIFVVGVKSTGIFCRSTCPARKPKRENVEFFANAHGALLAGYRPCKRCTPLSPAGAPPDWLTPLLKKIDDTPAERVRDADLRQRGLEPARVRRWFQKHHGMTFQAYQRARRLGAALGNMKDGQDVTTSAFESGYDSLSGFGTAFRSLFGAPPSKSGAALTVKRLLSPLGPLLAIADDTHLLLLEFVDRRALETQVDVLASRTKGGFVPGDNDVLRETERELSAYFRAALTRFSVPFRAPGTPFQERVWAALCDIPCGETRSYGALARALGKPTAQRAVAQANGKNRLAIVIPCHRVIGQDGSLSGYGGQVWRKKALLELEQRTTSLGTAT